MFILKNVVGKLWMTIIALVAVVLIILGLFLFQYIDNRFPTSNDQARSLEKLTLKVANEAAIHKNDESFLKSINDFLEAEDAGMVLLDRKSANVSVPLYRSESGIVLVSDVFSAADLETVFQGGTISRPYETSKSHRNNDFLAVAAPMRATPGAEVNGLLIVRQSLKSVENTQLYVKKLFAYVSIVGFLLTTFFAFFLITRITRPLKQLNMAADLITQGEYGVRVPVVSSDELGELAKTFNLMGGKLDETIKDLNHEKDNLSSVLRSMADAVISFDVKGNVIFTNPQGEQLMAEWSDIQWNDPQPQQVVRSQKIPEPLQLLFNDVVQETKEITSKLHVRSGVWSIIMAPLYSRELVRGAVAVLRDVTEEHRLDKLRKDFVANVSHELRTPLSMLQGYSEALIDDIAGSPEERKDLAQVIHDESLRMGRLVKDLLDLARMEAGHIEINFNEMNLSHLLKRVQRKFSVLCKEQGIQLISDDPDEEIILNHADQDRLEQVLTNLMDNAIRHTPADANIYLRAYFVGDTMERAVCIEIEDQGQGIPSQDLPFIFERFYKADKARTRGTSGGTGLGLAIVKNIVEAHQGTVKAKSVLGQGTTFSILLPNYKKQ